MPTNTHKKANALSEKLDVDTRFLLANERTLLAWIRTSLALQGGGLALHQFGKNGNDKLAITLIVLGAFTAIVGYLRFRNADKAIRSGTLPTTGRGLEIEVAIIIVIAFVILAFFR